MRTNPEDRNGVLQPGFKAATLQMASLCFHLPTKTCKIKQTADFADGIALLSPSHRDMREKADSRPDGKKS